MPAPATSLRLDSLAAASLIERPPDGTDRRRRIITLTEEGNNLLAIVADAAAAEQDHFLHTLSDTERKRLNHLLDPRPRLVGQLTTSHHDRLFKRERDHLSDTA